MTERHTTPPPSDVARLRVALWNIAGQLGIDLDSSMADHQVAELIAHRLTSGVCGEPFKYFSCGETFELVCAMKRGHDGPHGAKP